jgi:hypothetical protein
MADRKSGTLELNTRLIKSPRSLDGDFFMAEQRRLRLIVELAYQRGMEAMEEWAIDNSQPPHG